MNNTSSHGWVQAFFNVGGLGMGGLGMGGLGMGGLGMGTEMVK